MAEGTSKGTVNQQDSQAMQKESHVLVKLLSIGKKEKVKYPKNDICGNNRPGYGAKKSLYGACANRALDYSGVYHKVKYGEEHRVPKATASLPKRPAPSCHIKEQYCGY